MSKLLFKKKKKDTQLQTMKKTKVAKEEKTKNKPKMKICEHTHYCQHQLMSKPTKMSFCFRIKMERVRE